MGSDDSKDPLAAIGRQALANFTPAYVSILSFSFLLGLESSRIIEILFLAGLVAVALSAIQPIVLSYVLNPGSFVKDYADKSAEELLRTSMKEDENAVRSKISKKFAGEYSRRLRDEVEERILKKHELPHTLRNQLQNSEARLLGFLYLSIISGLYVISSTILFVVTPGLFDLIIISNPLALLGSYVFWLGYRNTSISYRQQVWRTIPVIAASDPQLDEKHIENKLDFIKRKLKDSGDTVSKQTYSDMVNELGVRLSQAKRYGAEKEWLDGMVAKATKLDADEVRRISQQVSLKTVYGKSVRTSYASLAFYLGIAFIFFVSILGLLFFFPAVPVEPPQEDVDPLPFLPILVGIMMITSLAAVGAVLLIRQRQRDFYVQ